MRKDMTVVCLLVALFGLSACGGGGGGGQGGQAATGGSGTGGSGSGSGSVTPPQVTDNSVSDQMNAGVFFFGGAGSTVNGVDQTYIRKVTNGAVSASDGLMSLTTSRFAGADSIFTNSLFDALPAHTLHSDVNFWVDERPVGPRVLYGENDLAELPTREFELALTVTDLAGTDISDHLLQSRSGHNAPPVTGTFGAGASAIKLTYTAWADKIINRSSLVSVLRDANFDPVTDVLALATVRTCFRNAVTGKALVLAYHEDGLVDLYDTSSNTPNQCAGTLPASMGQAVYDQRTLGVHGYLDFAFPPEVDFSQYSDAFTPTEFASGIRPVIAQSADANGWVVAYLISPGASFSDPVKHMNQKAAEDLKAVLALP